MLKHPKLTLFGPRVAIIEISDTLEGSIELPQTRHKVYSIGKVTHVGDGKVYLPGKKIGTYTPEIEQRYVEIDDIIMFQLPPQIVAAMTYQIGDKGYLFLHQSDALAKLTKPVCSLENFQIVGRYVLCTRERTSVTAGGIHLPDTVEDYNDDLNHFKVIQVGQQVTKCAVGDSLIVDRSKANPISLTGSQYFFIDEAWVHGVIG